MRTKSTLKTKWTHIQKCPIDIDKRLPGALSGSTKMSAAPAEGGRRSGWKESVRQEKALCLPTPGGGASALLLDKREGVLGLDVVEQEELLGGDAAHEVACAVVGHVA